MHSIFVSIIQLVQHTLHISTDWCWTLFSTTTFGPSSSVVIRCPKWLLDMSWHMRCSRDQRAHLNCTLLSSNIKLQSLLWSTYFRQTGARGGVSCFQTSQICWSSIVWSRWRFESALLVACEASTSFELRSWSLTVWWCGQNWRGPYPV